MTTTLPPIQNIQVATVPLAAFLSRQAAILAAAGTSTPLSAINFLNATVLVGDGNVSGSPQCPSISTLQSTAALTHQVWSGKIVQSSAQNSSNPNQIDLLCVIPAVDASGNEIGPFWVTEFIVTDENGTPMIAGVTAAPKFTVANGAITDLAFIVSVAFAIGTVVLTAPSEPFLSKSSAQAALANIVSGVPPITVTKSVDANGWIDFAVAVSLAAVPNLSHGEMVCVGNGATTWTCPAGVTVLEEVIVTGPGGPGAGGSADHGGGNGGAGGTAKGRVAVTPGQTYPIKSPAGPPGGAPGQMGSQGEDASAFGFTATGGSPGSYAPNGAGGPGGMGSGALDCFAGGCGADGMGTSAPFLGGMGGASYWGGGGRAANSDSPAVQDGKAPGSGGGGGYGGDFPGGAGAAAKIYWRW